MLFVNRLGLLRIFHDEQCHVGPEKTYESIAQHFWFPRLRNFIKCYIKDCVICAVRKRQEQVLYGGSYDQWTFHTHMDCLGPLTASNGGYKHVLVMVDAFTKYCILTSMKSVTTLQRRLKSCMMF
ncbi:unnamed protein product [Acanthoscelides obtectus]|uniref:Integrase zinc-binding domain-containing protein n=1 Tax=Acanthoscelides obtectus TaxID=200917 RepID=A0A9P0K993_ACAOB|nr:unnamed protein product [Acanthoscelides obtectus]CAK1653432.1 Protein NYNRIN [Acanthoscelides obtectus]